MDDDRKLEEKKYQEKKKVKSAVRGEIAIESGDEKRNSCRAS